MLKQLLKRYFAVPLIYRIGAAFVFGVAAGILLSGMGSRYGSAWLGNVTGCIAPFGTVLIAMLKMIVIPIIFFSLVNGAASLPVRKFGKLGTGVLLWYFFTDFDADIVEQCSNFQSFLYLRV